MGVQTSLYEDGGLIDLSVGYNHVSTKIGVAMATITQDLRSQSVIEANRKPHKARSNDLERLKQSLTGSQTR